MKQTKSIVLAVILGIIAIMGMYVYHAQSKLNTLNEEVSAAWSVVESDYQRRADLLPNMVEIVKRFAKQEKDILKDVGAAHTRYAGAEDKIGASRGLDRAYDNAFARLLTIRETYPELKSSEQFSNLQVQWEGTENRIKYSRNKFTERVKAYNMHAGTLTGRFWVRQFGFDEKKAYFEADPGASKAPSAKENFKD